MNLGRLIDSIKNHEGYVKEPYRDHLGFWTVGFGHLIENTDICDFINSQNRIIETLGDLSDALTDESLHLKWLNDDITEAVESAKLFAGEAWGSINDRQREVIAEMAYQMGRSRLFTFRRFQEAVKSGQREMAVSEMLSSKWARQTPSRAAYLAAKFSTND